MRQDMLKRVGMLAASAAVCSAVAGGGLMMQGMRYVRPTAENWTLLPYAEPAAKVEQTVGRSSKGEEFSRDYVSLTGYDEQGREIWKKNRFYTDPALRSEHWTYDGDTVTWHTITNGIKGDTYLQYDAQGRMVRQEAGDIITVYSYRGDETKPYLTEAHSVEGVLRSRGTAEIDPETGERTANITVYDANGNETYSTVDVTNERGHTVSMDGDRWEWTYDDAAHTATCTRADGAVDYYQFDEQGRVLSEKSQDPDGDLREVQKTEYTDVTR